MTFVPFLLCVLSGGMVRSHTVRTFPPYPHPLISILGQEGLEDMCRAGLQENREGRKVCSLPLLSVWGEEGSLSSPSLVLLSLCGWNWHDVPQIIYSSLSTQEDCFPASLPVELESWTRVLDRQPVQPWYLKDSFQSFTHSPLPTHEMKKKGL